MDGRCHFCGYTFGVYDRVYNYQKHVLNRLHPITIDEFLVCDECDTESRRLFRKLKRQKEDEKDGGEQSMLDAMEAAICRGENSFGDD